MSFQQIAQIAQIAQITQITQEINDLENVILNDKESLYSINVEIKKLSKEEKFIEAQKFLEQREEKTEKMKNAKVRIDELEKERDALIQSASKEINFDKMFSKVKVTQVVVYDPLNGDYATAEYFDGSDTIVIHLSSERFESEAYHLDSWCKEYNFISDYREKEVVF